MSKYTPNEDAFIVTYWNSKFHRDGKLDTADVIAEARRGIAKIKADALREFAGEWEFSDAGLHAHMWDKADRIEKGA